MEKKTAEDKHPLTAKNISCIGDWSHWKDIWKETSEVEILHSLLHFGFDVYTKSEEFAEKVAFYLELADGYRASYNFNSSPDPKWQYDIETPFGRKKYPEVRQVLSHKAFQILCQKVFRDTRKSDYDLPSWLYIIFQKEIFEKIIWFFRLDEGGWIENSRLNESHLSEITEKFLVDLCKFIWSDNKNIERHREWLENMYPDFVEMLFGIRKLELLLDRECKFVTDEDGFVYKSIMDKLKELALKHECYFNGKRRKPINIHEAFYGGSQAAKIHILLSIKNAERKRLEEIQELENQKKEAEEKLKKLQ